MAYTIIKTELEAVNLALDLWAFLKSTGDEKDDYLIDIENLYLAGCPLCQFHIMQDLKDSLKLDKDLQQFRSGCVQCCLGKHTLCRFNNTISAYRKWTDYLTTKEQKMKQAEIIYNAILKRKEKLEAQREQVNQKKKRTLSK